MAGKKRKHQQRRKRKQRPKHHDADRERQGPQQVEQPKLGLTEQILERQNQLEAQMREMSASGKADKAKQLREAVKDIAVATSAIASLGSTLWGHGTLPSQANAEEAPTPRTIIETPMQREEGYYVEQDTSDLIKEWAKLRRDGVITQKEYRAKEKRLLVHSAHLQRRYKQTGDKADVVIVRDLPLSIKFSPILLRHLVNMKHQGKISKERYVKIKDSLIATQTSDIEVYATMESLYQVDHGIIDENRFKKTRDDIIHQLKSGKSTSS